MCSEQPNLKKNPCKKAFLFMCPLTHLYNFNMKKKKERKIKFLKRYCLTHLCMQDFKVSYVVEYRLCVISKVTSQISPCENFDIHNFQIYPANLADSQ